MSVEIWEMEQVLSEYSDARSVTLLVNGVQEEFTIIPGDDGPVIKVDTI